MVTNVSMSNYTLKELKIKDPKAYKEYMKKSALLQKARAKELKQYVILKNIKTPKQADKTAKAMGWSSDKQFKKDTGVSLLGYWDLRMDDPYVDKPKGKLKNIDLMTVLAGRAYPTTVKAFVDDKKRAYMRLKKVEKILF